jgi:hypothetical protein
MDDQKPQLVMQSPIKSGMYTTAFSYGSEKEISYEYSSPIRQVRDDRMIPIFQPRLESHLINANDIDILSNCGGYELPPKIIEPISPHQ